MAKNQDLKDQEIGTEISEQFRLAKRYLDPIHERMNLQEELYRSYIDKNTYPHGAKVFDPRVFRVIETVTPRMVANEPTGSFYPAESDDVAKAHIFNALIKYDWRRAEMFPKMVNFVKGALIFGTAFGRMYWDFRECDKVRMKPKEINGRMRWSPQFTETISVTEFDGPNFEVLNIYDCYPDPNATSLHNMRWFIYRTFNTIKELESEDDGRDEKKYKNLDVLKQKVADKAKGKTKGSQGDQPTVVGMSMGQLQYREHRRIMLSTQELLGQDESNPEIVLLRQFTKDRWRIIAPEYDNLVIMDAPNPYFHGQLPIVHMVDYPYPGELYGMGEIESIDRIQRAINAVLNQRLDNVQLTLRTMWKVKKNSGVDMHTLISAPGNIVTVKDMDSVEALQTPDVTGSTFVQTMNYLTSSLQNGSGITDYTLGINDRAHSTNDTATGTRLIQNEANAMFKLKIQLMNHMVIQKIANQWKDLRIQYTTENQKLRIIGKEAISYLKENTNLAITPLDGKDEVIPGDYETKTKLQIAKDGSFAFLNLFPDDIQPAVVGDYDFIASPSAEQLTDPIVLQENFFSALDRVTNPEWTKGLASQGKQLDYVSATQKVFDKLNIGIEGDQMVKPLQAPEQQQGVQTISPEQIQQQLHPDNSPVAMMGGAMAPQQAPQQNGGAI